MASVIPSGYAWRDGAGYMNESDNSGPYALSSTGDMALTSGTHGTEYETVAASQTAQVLGATGATGDYIKSLILVVSTAATAQPSSWMARRRSRFFLTAPEAASAPTFWTWA